MISVPSATLLALVVFFVGLTLGAGIASGAARRGRREAFVAGAQRGRATASIVRAPDRLTLRFWFAQWDRDRQRGGPVLWLT